MRGADSRDSGERVHEGVSNFLRRKVRGAQKEGSNLTRQNRVQLDWASAKVLVLGEDNPTAFTDLLQPLLVFDALAIAEMSLVHDHGRPGMS